MPVAIEGEPRAFRPAVPCCPQHGIARKLVEAIPGINEGQPLRSVIHFTTGPPLCLGNPGRVLPFLSLDVPKVIIDLPGTKLHRPVGLRAEAHRVQRSFDASFQTSAKLDAPACSLGLSPGFRKIALGNAPLPDLSYCHGANPWLLVQRDKSSAHECTVSRPGR